MAEAHDSPKFLGGWVVCMQWPLVVMAQTKTPRHKQKLHGTNKNSTAQTKTPRHKQKLHGTKLQTKTSRQKQNIATTQTKTPRQVDITSAICC
jgi:hypothetical protein